MAQESLQAETGTAHNEHGAAAAPPPLEPWQAIRKHKVVQWAVVYATASVPLLQGVAIVSNTLDWPHVVARIVTLVLALGFPVVITLAWFHGHRALHRVSGAELLILTGLLAVAGVVLWSFGRAHEKAAKLPPEKSVAVLPFVNMSDDKSNEYFADGLSEELIDLLAKVQEIRVPARTSSFFFKGKQATVAEIAKTLNVAHVLEGSVRRSGSTLRVTTQLIRAATGYDVWSQTFDRQTDDIFKIQDDIAGSVVKELKVSLLEGESLPTATTTNKDAYDLYLKARSLRRHGSKEDVDTAIDDLRQATKSDPKFAPGWAQLSIALGQHWAYWGTLPFEKTRAEAHAAADEAIRLDPNLGAGHLAKGKTALLFDWDWDTAEAELEKAIRLDPGDAEALTEAAILNTNLGRFDEAIRLGQEAAARDPVGPGYLALGYTYLVSGKLEEAEAARRRGLELDPTASENHCHLGLVLLARNEPTAALEEIEQDKSPMRFIGLAMALDALGRRGEADQELAAAERFANVAYNIAQVYALRGDPDRAFTWLERAYRQRDSGMPQMKVDVMLKNLRGDPRYAALLRKMKLPEDGPTR
jgi:TolB-like protein/Flp pilus assembly protein TadD